MNTSPDCPTISKNWLKRKRSSAKQIVDGKRVRTPTFYSWHAMKNRCLRPEVEQYPRYGGRGITVCKEWAERGGFDRFLADMGGRPPGTFLDRIDNDGHYCKENCRWATAKQNSRNRSVTQSLTVDGVTRPLTEWSEISGLKPRTIRSRIKYGWSHKDAVEAPADRWSAEDTEAFRVMWNLEATLEEMSKRFGTSKNSLSVKASAERIKVPGSFHLRRVGRSGAAKKAAAE